MHAARRATSRAAWTAGSNSATNTPMIAITTNSSINVNPQRMGMRIGLMRRLVSRLCDDSSIIRVASRDVDESPDVGHVGRQFDRRVAAGGAEPDACGGSRGLDPPYFGFHEHPQSPA